MADFAGNVSEPARIVVQVEEASEEPGSEEETLAPPPPPWTQMGYTPRVRPRGIRRNTPFVTTEGLAAVDASSGNLTCVAALGATAIDYRNEGVRGRIGELTGDGVDIVIDPIGGELTAVTFSADQLDDRMAGHFSTFGRVRSSMAVQLRTTRPWAILTPSLRSRAACSTSLPGTRRPVEVTTRHQGSPGVTRRRLPTARAAPG